MENYSKCWIFADPVMLHMCIIIQLISSTLYVFQILQQLEKRTGRKITDIFDWIVGTSIGALVALLLVYRKVSLDECQKLFFRMKDEVFAIGRMGLAGDTEAMERNLHEFFGTEARMSDVKHPRFVMNGVLLVCKLKLCSHSCSNALFWVFSQNL